MKNRFFTYLLVLAMPTVGTFAQDIGTGNGWETVFQEALVLDEDFSSFAFFHSDEDPYSGSSDNILTESFNIIPGYNDMEQGGTFNNSTTPYTYTFDSCAFAPNWAPAYAYNDDGGNSGDSNTPNVSNGFVEISRQGGAFGGKLPTSQGWFTIDLSNLKHIEGIQYTTSSCGGTRRGFTLEISKDGGTSWDTLRYQPGATAEYFTSGGWNGFSQDPSNNFARTYNYYRCDPSAYGMVWEDGIYLDQTVEGIKIRFTEGGGHFVRVHDLKVYGKLPLATNNSRTSNVNLELIITENKIAFNENVNILLYNIHGQEIMKKCNTNMLSMQNIAKGAYVINAYNNTHTLVKKVIIH